MPIFALANSVNQGYWPFLVLGICVASLVILITVLRVHAFIALILVAIGAGCLSMVGSLPGEAEGKSHWLQAVELATTEFGVTAGKIGVVIGLAAIISFCLMESGAADKVVRRFIALFGEKHAGTAIVVSSYILSIPIFFDTFFMLLLPLARALRLRTGKNYLLYILAICCAGVVTHSLMAPHPGPLAMAESLKVDLGITIIVGLFAGILPVAGGWMAAKYINRHMEIPLREVSGSSTKDLADIVGKPESELPSFFWSIIPVILPILLIAGASFASALSWQSKYPSIYPTIEFAGNRNIALLVGAIISMGILMRQKKMSLARVNELIGPSFETAGVCILITAAGGAFGLMLKNAGVGEAIKLAAAGREINMILLAWSVAAVIRIAQGSATVAMLTTSAMIYPLMNSGTPLPYNEVYIFLAIGFGAMILSWMNDSGFWIVSKLSGFTEKETLKTWTVVLTVMSLCGLVECLILAKLFPLR